MGTFSVGIFVLLFCFCFVCFVLLCFVCVCTIIQSILSLLPFLKVHQNQLVKYHGSRGSGISHGSPPVIMHGGGHLEGVPETDPGNSKSSSHTDPQVRYDWMS